MMSCLGVSRSVAEISESTTASGLGCCDLGQHGDAYLLAGDLAASCLNSVSCWFKYSFSACKALMF